MPRTGPACGAGRNPGWIPASPTRSIPTSDLRATLQRTLAGTYTIQRELGGGMSRVYLGEETALGRRVVIKTLPMEASPLCTPMLDPLHELGSFRKLLARYDLGMCER